MVAPSGSAPTVVGFAFVLVKEFYLGRFSLSFFFIFPVVLLLLISALPPFVMLCEVNI